MRLPFLSCHALSSCAPIAAALCVASGGALAQARPQPQPAITKPGPDATFESARAAFEALPEADRRAIQEALVWTGDYNAAVSGEFGRRSFEAINAYLARAKRPTGGVLDMQTRKALLATAQRAKEAIKFTVSDDARTGVRIGVPEGLLVKREINPRGGSRWQSADGRITLDTRVVPPAEANLASLYERSITADTPGRQVTYKLLRPDFFVVSGETPTGKFYLRYAAGPGGLLRGFSLGYDKTLAKDFDRTVIAIANSFAPFPHPASTPVVAQPVDAAPAAREPAQPKPPIASGIVVGAGRVLTSTVAAACADLRVGTAKARVLKADQANGLALLEGETAATPAIALASAGAADESVLVLSYAAGPGAGLVVTPADVVTGRVVAALQPGASGGPVFDRNGALVGVVGAMPSTAPMVAGIVPPLAYPLISAEAVERLLRDSSLAVMRAELRRRSAGQMAAEFGPSLIPVTCAD